MDFLGRARKVLRGISPPEPPRPHYFNVECSQGHPIRGLRSESYQALRCPTCGAGVFVLPRSPLPDPPAPSTLRPRRRRPAPAPVVEDAPILLSDPPPQEDVEEVVWLDPDPAEAAEAELAESQALPVEAEVVHIDDDQAPDASDIPPEYLVPPEPRPEPPRPSPKKRPGPRQAPRPSRPREPEPVPQPAVEGRFVVVPEPSGLRAWAGRHRLMLVLVGVGLLVAVTVGYRIWRDRMEKLPQIAESSWDEGRAALEDGRFDEAKHELARAADAFARLGITDERATGSRQLADEAAILADRCRLQPEELIDEAGTANPGEWSSRFEALYRGRSIVLDTSISETPKTSRRGRYEVDYQIYSGRGPIPGRQGVIDLTEFQLFETLQPKRGQPVLFGGRIDALTFEDGVWHLRLAPDSGVVMTHQEGLKHADWEPKQSASASPDEEAK